jgi:hypothetical protein
MKTGMKTTIVDAKSAENNKNNKNNKNEILPGHLTAIKPKLTGNNTNNNRTTSETMTTTTQKAGTFNYNATFAWKHRMLQTNSDNTSKNNIITQNNGNNNTTNNNGKANDIDGKNKENNTNAKALLTAENAATKYATRWNITVTPNSTNNTIDIQQVLIGILQALQYIEPTTWIKQHGNTIFNGKGIFNIKDIPTTKEEGALFMEDMRKSKQGKIIFCLQIITNTMTKEIIYSPQFKTWLKEQRIYMEISELELPNPQYVGFLDTPIPELRKLPLMKKRFQNAYPEESGQYQIVLALIHIDG